MDTTSFVSEAIRYQKMASDQIFQIMSMCQDNSEELLQKTLDQCAWLPGGSKESCLKWSASCRETTSFLQDMVDKGFEQVEQVFVAPAINEIPEKRSQPKKTSPTPKKKAKAPSKKVTRKPVAAKAEASKSAPSKTKVSVQKSQVSTPKRDTAAPSKPLAAAENVSAKPVQPQSKPSANSTTPGSTADGGVKAPETPSVPSNSSTPTK